MPAVLAVGTVAYDSVKTPFGEAEEVLGGSGSFFSVSASYFTQVHLVACVGSDFRKDYLEVLNRRNIDLEGLEYMEGQTFRWKGEYGYDLNEARTLDTQLNVFAHFRPKIPQAYRELEFIFLGNIDPALQLQVLKQVKTPRVVACDTMNYWISGHFESLQRTLREVHILMINEAEMRQLAGEANLVRAARRVLDWGPHTVVIKRGEYGVLMFQKSSGRELSVFAAPAYPLESVFDPTGAGDSFAGGFMGYLAGTGKTDAPTVRQAIIFGSVMASFNVEKFSLDRLKELTYTEIELRYQEFQEMMKFEGVVQRAE